VFAGTAQRGTRGVFHVPMTFDRPESKKQENLPHGVPPMERTYTARMKFGNHEVKLCCVGRREKGKTKAFALLVGEGRDHTEITTEPNVKGNLRYYSFDRAPEYRNDELFNALKVCWCE
jgi:hypothetical protein